MRRGNRYRALCLVLLACGILVLHCKKKVAAPDPLDHKLIGGWISTEAYTVGSGGPSPYSSIAVTFDDDYSGVLEQRLTEPDTLISSPFTWRVVGSNLYLKFTGSVEEMAVPIEFTADAFKMTITETYQWVDETTHQLRSIPIKTKITFRRAA
jgi:hypothetical protein